jgi:DNA polymerase epsilon subunit 1
MFCIKDESKASMDGVLNYDEVKSEIQTALELIRDDSIRFDKPLIYHLDIAAMYPNIMLSNRLRPDSMVDEADSLFAIIIVLGRSVNGEGSSSRHVGMNTI